jgi:hypothetical protein
VREINEVWPFMVDYLESHGFDVEVIRKVVAEYEAHVVPGYHQLGIGQLIHYLNVGRTFAKARALYIPSTRINTGAHFFKASQSAFRHRRWKAYCKGTYQCYKIDGTHFSILQPPQVLTLAKLFNKALENAALAKG